MRRPHEHCWTNWDLWRQKRPDFSRMVIVREKDVVPAYIPLEAYRWRYCECGAAEREDYQGVRKLFERED